MRNLLYVVGFLMVFTFDAQSAIRCEHIFITKKQFDRIYNPEKLSKKQSQKILDAAGPDKESGSTTGDRIEYKFTLTKETITRKINQFKDLIEAEINGFTLTNRDPLTPGFKNVTWTAYSNRFKLTIESGEKLVAKIRVRKYGLIADSANITKNNFNPIESMKDISYFEFKIENPEHENSVLKPRMKIKDSDASLLLEPSLTKSQAEEIVARCVELNTMRTAEEQLVMNETIRLMIRAVRGIHKKGSFYAPEYETIYERVSYKIPLKNKETGQTYEVQITLDENISASSIAFDYTTLIYQNGAEPVAVTEVKVPIALLEDLQNKAFDKIVGLKSVDMLLEYLKFNNLKDFEENHGKLFHLRRDLKEEIQPDDK